MLQAIVMVESGQGHKAHPYAINLRGKAYYPKTAREALKIVTKEDGSIEPADIGCGQISMRYHLKGMNGDPKWALDPNYNLAYAAHLLIENYQRHGTWTKAVAHYHSGKIDRQWAYVCRVLRKMQKIQQRTFPMPDQCGKL
jgi:hypothetical protein